jgi:hypothetical protein
MKKMRQIKLMALAAVVAGALAVPAVGSAAGGSATPVTAAGIKVKPCTEKDVLGLLMFVRGVDCHTALVLANEASSGDDPCPLEWHSRRVHLKARIDGKITPGPSVFLCTQKAGKRAFTYIPTPG